MKKLAILILLSLFVLAGCQDDNSILAPNNDYASDDLSKGRPILGLGDDSFITTEDFDNLDDLEDADSGDKVKPKSTSIIDETTGKSLSK